MAPIIFLTNFDPHVNPYWVTTELSTTEVSNNNWSLAHSIVVIVELWFMISVMNELHEDSDAVEDEL